MAVHSNVSPRELFRQIAKQMHKSTYCFLSQISCVVWMFVPLTNPDWEVTEIVVIGILLYQKIYKNRTMIITNIMKWYNIEYFKPR
jgi:hypothetical protein